MHAGILQTAEYIVAGRTNSFGAGDYDIYIIKLNHQAIRYGVKL